MAETEDLTFTVTDANGDESEVTLPGGLVDAFAEEGDTRAEVAGDVLQMAFTERAHAVVHHGEGEVGPGLEAAEERALDLFEKRFGVTYGEATGHQH
jgi:hypothetical protein